MDWRTVENWWNLEWELYPCPCYCGSSTSYANFFASETLDGLRGKESVKLSTLKALSVSALSFKTSAEMMASAFEFSGLRSLTLRKCPGAVSLLKTLVDTNLTIQLTSFEIMANEVNEDEWGTEVGDPVSRFLGFFTGLEELSISIRKSEGHILNIMKEYIRNHKQTLKRLVYEDARVNSDEENCYRHEQSGEDEITLGNMVKNESEAQGLEYRVA